MKSDWVTAPLASVTESCGKKRDLTISPPGAVPDHCVPAQILGFLDVISQRVARPRSRSSA